jgi:hypothetical protein
MLILGFQLETKIRLESETSHKRFVFIFHSMTVGFKYRDKRNEVCIHLEIQLRRVISRRQSKGGYVLDKIVSQLMLRAENECGTYGL